MIGTGAIFSAAVVIGILIWLFIVRISRAARGPSGTIRIEPATRVEVTSDRIRVTVTMPESDADYQITQVLFPRELGERLCVAAPAGFRAVPYAYDDTNAPTNIEAENWVEESNRNDIRWLGTLVLRTDISTTLDFPIRRKVNGEGVLSFRCEATNEAVERTSFVVVPIVIEAD